MDQTHTKPDYWADTLNWLMEHFDYRHHPLQVLSGLPLEEGGLDSELFLRAAEKASLTLTLVDSGVLQHARFPLVATDRQCQPVIVCGESAGKYRVVCFGREETEQLWTLAELKAQIEPQVWQVAAKGKADPRLSALPKAKKSHWLWSVVKEVRPWYRDLLVASLMINLLALVVPLFTMNVYDRVVPNQAFNTLWVLVAGVSVVVVFDWLLREARSAVTDSAGSYIDNKLSAVLFSRVLGMKLEHRPQSVGAFSRQLQDFDSVRDFFTSVTLVTLVDLPFTLLFLLLIGWLGGAMMLVPVAMMLLLLLLSVMMRSRIEAAHTETAMLSSQRQAQLFDNLTSLPEIKQNNAEGEAQRRWEQTVSSLSEWQNRSRYFSNLVAHSIQSSQQIVTISLIVFGVYQIAAGNLSMGGLIAIVMLSGRAAGAVSQLSMLLLRYQQTKTAVEGLTSIVELPQEESDSSQLSNAAFQGEVRFEEVGYQYPEAPGPCLKEISFHIRKGERVGLIGAAGAGKSTLMSLVAKQLTPLQGRIFYDEVDSQLWPSSVIRQQSGWVGQNAQLLFGSVIDNITLGDSQVDQTRLGRAVELSGLNHYMPRLANGLETQVGEGGRYLSGGQRQAVALARALYRSPNLLLLDEPSSALDKQAEARLFHSLQTMPRDTSMLISSHKQSFLAMCDRLLVLENGAIVAEGTPSQILTAGAKQSGSSRVRSVSVVRGGRND